MEFFIVIAALVAVWTGVVLLLGKRRKAQTARGQQPRRRSRQEEPEVPPGRITGTTTGFQ